MLWRFGAGVRTYIQGRRDLIGVEASAVKGGYRAIPFLFHSFHWGRGNTFIPPSTLVKGVIFNVDGLVIAEVCWRVLALARALILSLMRCLC